MKHKPLYYFVKAILYVFAKVAFPSTVQHKENCPKSGRVILCCNHLGLSDPVRLVFAHRRQIFFMSKAELFKIKPFGWLLKQCGVFPVQRGKGDVGAMNMASNLLENECALGIFIEGTRSKNGELGQPKAGAVMLSYKHHAPILPICITPIGSKFPRVFHRSILSYGKPILPEELAIENGTGTEFRNASRLVMERITQLREQDLRTMAHSTQEA